MNYNTELAVGVAAAAYAINSLVEDEARYRIKIERSRQDTTSRVRNSDRATRRSNEIQTIGISHIHLSESSSGETSSRRSMEKDYRSQESSLLRSKAVRRSSSARPVSMEAEDRSRKANYSQPNVGGTKADAWEKAEIEKLNRRCENMKASILAWEKQKKLRAQVRMDRRKKDLEQKIKISQQLYQNKISRIDQIAGGARSQVDENRRNEELKIKDKARTIRASGKVPVTCFCF